MRRSVFLVSLLLLALVLLQPNVLQAQILGASSYSQPSQTFTGTDMNSPCKTCEIDCLAITGVFSSCKNRYYRYGCHINSHCVDVNSANTNEFIAAFAICTTINECRPTLQNRVRFAAFRPMTPLYKLMQDGKTSLQVQYQYFQWDPAVNTAENYHVKYKRLFFSIMKMHGPFFYYFKVVQDIKDNMSAFKSNPALIRLFVAEVNNQINRLPEWLKFTGYRRWDEGIITRTFRPITYYDVLNIMAQMQVNGVTYMDQIMGMMQDYVARKSAAPWNHVRTWYPSFIPRFQQIIETLDFDYAYGNPFAGGPQSNWDQNLVNELNVGAMSVLKAYYIQYAQIDAEFVNRMIALPCFDRLQYLPKRYQPINIYMLMQNDPKLIIDSWFWFPDLSSRWDLQNLFNQVVTYDWMLGTVTATSNSPLLVIWVNGREIHRSSGLNYNPGPTAFWMQKQDSIVAQMTVGQDTMDIPQFIARFYVGNGNLVVESSSSWYCFEMANPYQVPNFNNNNMDKNQIRDFKYNMFGFALENDVVPQSVQRVNFGAAQWITRNNYYGDYVDYRKRVLTSGTLITCRYDPPDLQEVVVYS